MDYAEGNFNIGPTSPRGAARDFLSSGLSLMGLSLLAESHFESAVQLPPHLFDMDCEGDLVHQSTSGFVDVGGCALRWEPSHYLLRGGEINTSRQYRGSAGSTHTPLFLVPS